MMAVAVHENGSGLDIAAARPLFRTTLKPDVTTVYAVTTDGQRFLIPIVGEQNQTSGRLFTVIVNPAVGPTK